MQQSSQRIFKLGLNQNICFYFACEYCCCERQKHLAITLNYFHHKCPVTKFPAGNRTSKRNLFYCSNFDFPVPASLSLELYYHPISPRLSINQNTATGKIQNSRCATKRNNETSLHKRLTSRYSQKGLVKAEIQVNARCDF